MQKSAHQTVGEESRALGLYRDFAGLRSGVDCLRALHFGDDDISVLFPEVAVSKDLTSFSDLVGNSPEPPVAFIGGTLGWLTYVRPEGVGIISAALVELGVPEAEAELYEERLRDGCLLACVRSVSDCAGSAMQALVLTGAERVIAARTLSPADKLGVAGLRELTQADSFLDEMLVC